MKEEEIIVVELIKKWMNQYQAAFLAKESQIVYWGHAVSNADEEEWVKWTLTEAVNIFRSTIIPFGLMKLCTPDAVRIAAQEAERSYVSGVYSDTLVLPHLFNFNHKQLEIEILVVDWKYELMKRIIKVLEKTQRNVYIVDVGRVFDGCYLFLDMSPISNQAKNKLMRKVLSTKGCGYVERNYSNRYKYEGRVHAILKYEKASGIQSLSEEEVNHYVLRSLRGSIASEKFCNSEQKILLNETLGI